MTAILTRASVARVIPARPRGLWPLLVSEAFAAAIGFGVLIGMARRLGPHEFAAVESAAAVAAVLLVLVRSGIEQVVVREAARRPRLISPLTETLIGLKLACATVAFLGLVVLAFAFRQPAMVLVAGLILFPSALVADVGPRARGRLGPIAIAQSLRAVGLLAATFLLVKSSADALPAAACMAIAETVSAAALGVFHIQEFGAPRLRFCRRAWSILGRRGMVASVSRLGRVAIYSADMLALAAFSQRDLGAYAAARRVVFAMIGLGLVLPAAFAPSIASAWMRGCEPAKKAISVAIFSILNFAVPAAIGLILTAEGWMTLLFGSDYRGSGLALAVVAARAPFLLAASLYQVSLVAVRRELVSLRVVILMLILAMASVPAGSWFFGPIGAGIAMIGIEVLGAWMGWQRLRRLDVAPPVLPLHAASIIGCAAMIAMLLILRNRPVWEASLAAGAAFFGAWLLVGRSRAR